MTYPVEHVVAAQCQLGEGPIWHPDENALYWLDIIQANLHRFDPSTGAHETTPLGVVTGSMGLRQGGGFVMATKEGFGYWDQSTLQFDFFANPDETNPDARFNDGKTDPQGRFWAGKMSDKPENSLFRVDPDGAVQRMESGIHISNGLGWSPDHKTFYYTDTPTMCIYAYDFDSQTGSIANRRVFARVPDGEGYPDGLAVDAEGGIWSARWGGWKVVHYAPDGSVIDEIRLPVELVTSCAFGGPDLDELYITSAWVDVKAREKQPQAGDVFKVKTGVRGIAEPFFQG